jgi:hypothetical protein
MKHIMRSGELDAIYNQYYGDIVADLRLDQRQVIILENPFIPGGGSEARDLASRLRNTTSQSPGPIDRPSTPPLSIRTSLNMINKIYNRLGKIRPARRPFVEYWRTDGRFPGGELVRNILGDDQVDALLQAFPNNRQSRTRRSCDRGVGTRQRSCLSQRETPQAEKTWGVWEISLLGRSSRGGTRTPNARIMIPLLYRLSYPAE